KASCARGRSAPGRWSSGPEVRAERAPAGCVSMALSGSIEMGVHRMQTDQILDRKGRDVATIAPDSPVRAAVEQLGTANVGALVVSADGSSVVGIVSERDVVRRLAADGPSLLDAPVS